jgi:D-alanyl-D-alanine carboxypeptidase
MTNVASCVRVLFAAYLLLIAPPAIGSPVVASKPSVSGEIVPLATQVLRTTPAWGLSVAVARNGKIIFAQGFGHSRADTVYHIDSVTKNVTAAAILRLADEGKLRLDDSIAEYVPDLPPLYRDIVIRELLNHTSGIKDFTQLPQWGGLEAKHMSHAQILALLRPLSLDFPHGTSWRYSNSGFYLLGLVIERASGRSYGEYVRSLSHSLHLKHINFGCPGTSGHGVEKGRLVPSKPINWETPYSAGGLCTTVGDLVAWGSALNAGKVLSDKSLALMRAPAHLKNGISIDYGLGTRLGSLEGHLVVGHTGTGGGFNAVLQVYPSDHLSIAVLANGSAFSANALAASIARKLLSIPDQALGQAEATLPRPLTYYTGVYASGDGPIEIYADQGQLAFRVPQGPKLGTMTFLNQDMFAVAPDVFVKLLGKGAKAEWGLSYEHGLMMDAKRRMQ